MDAGEDLDERALARRRSRRPARGPRRAGDRARRRRAPGSRRTAWRSRAARCAAARPRPATRSPGRPRRVRPVGRRRIRGHVRTEDRTSMPRAASARTIASGAARRSGRSLISSVGQNVANAARSHFVWSTMAMTSRAAATIERLIWASSSVASASPDSRVNPAAPRNAFWTLIRLNRPSPSWPTTDSASQRTRPPSISTVMPGMTGELRGDPQAVRDDRQLAPAAARLEVTGDRQGRRARVHDDALAVVDERGRGNADPSLLVGLQALADLEGELGAAPVDGDRAAVGPDESVLGLEGRRGPCGS